MHRCTVIGHPNQGMPSNNVLLARCLALQLHLELGLSEYIYIYTYSVYIYTKEPHWNPVLMRCHHCSTKTSAVNLWQQMQLVNPSGDRIEEVFHIIDPWLRQLQGGCAKGLTVTHQKRWWHGGNLSH